MDLVTLIGIAFAVGGLGGLAGYALGTRLIRQAGGYEDHEERLGILESLTRTVQRAQKAERMRQLRSASGEVEKALAGGEPAAQSSLNLDPRAVKAELRRKIMRGMQ